MRLIPTFLRPRRSCKLLALMGSVLLVMATLASAVWLNGSSDGKSNVTNAAMAAQPQPTTITLGTTVVFGYNDLGMHCLDEDFSEMMILPPYNILHATVIDRGSDPKIVTSGVTVSYSIPSNTHSADKTNFWTHAQALLGVNLAPNIGLTGNGLSGAMVATGTDEWVATGIPITPIDDSGRENPFPLSLITVGRNGQVVARTQTVVPSSWEMNCNLCHNAPGISVATDILRTHDNLHGTDLEHQKPVRCSKCHADPALGQPGVPGVKTLSHAMHGSHAPRMAQANLPVPCYACHPGLRTKCLRDVHSSKGMNCMSCHGQVTDVANPTRRPWVDQPRCGDCHTRTGYDFEQANTLYKDSKGHHGVPCAVCHGSPHAITPTTTAADNTQAIAIQGHSGPIDTCTVCHVQTPDGPFDHRAND